MKANRSHFALALGIVILLSGCIGTFSQVEEEIQRVLNDLVVLESLHIHFLTGEYTIDELMEIAARIYAEHVIVYGHRYSYAEIIENYKELWRSWEDLDYAELEQRRAELGDRKFVMEVRNIEIVLSTKGDEALVEGVLYCGFLEPSGEIVDEYSMEVVFQLKRAPRLWRITSLMEQSVSGESP